MSPKDFQEFALGFGAFILFIFGLMAIGAAIEWLRRYEERD